MHIVKLEGFLNLDKPRGLTSRDAVDLVVRMVGRRVRVGHAGTLDPLATGVLVVAIGGATRLIERVQGQPKVYRTTVRLGVRSDTLDADGTVVEAEGFGIPSETAVRAAIAAQVGVIRQVPPAYSALKLGGRRAHELARAGEVVELAARPVTVGRIDLLGYDWPRVELEIACGGGTYIRSIARDLGEALGCGGLVEVLTRTRIGPFRLEEAIDPRGRTEEGLAERLLPLTEAIGDLPRCDLDEGQVGLVRQGRPLDAGRLAGGRPPGGEVALLGPDGSLVALAEHDAGAGLVRPRKVLGGAAG